MDWEIRDQQGALHTSRYGSGVMDHFRERDLGGVFVAKNDHADRIANQNDVNPAFVQQPAGWIIVGGQRRDTFAPQFLVAKILHR